MSECLLDASAVLALVNDEPGAERVARVVAESAICAVNLAEAVGKLCEFGMDGDEAARMFTSLGLAVFAFGTAEARIAGELAPLTRPRGLSLGDRACLATARSLGLPVLTADRTWANLGLDIDIQLIR